MKQKYESLDDRTGIKQGEIVELSMEELNKIPFNVDMKLAVKSQEKPKQTNKVNKE